MSNELKIFESEEFGFEVGVITLDNKEYFPATQIAKLLGYSNPHKAIRDHCKGVTKRSLLTDGGCQEINLIPEGDLYRLIVKSKLPTAEKFEKWVFEEVLPDIRKRGIYATDVTVDNMLNNPDFMIELLTNYKQEKEQRKLLEAKVEEDKPKVENYEILMDSKGDVDFNNFVKSADLSLGRNQFFNFLREEGIIRPKPSTEPYEQFRKQGYFRVIQTTNNNHSNSKTLITKKGINWLTNKCKQWNIIK